MSERSVGAQPPRRRGLSVSGRDGARELLPRCSVSSGRHQGRTVPSPGEPTRRRCSRSPPRRAATSRRSTSTTASVPSRRRRPRRRRRWRPQLGAEFRLVTVEVAAGPNLEARARDARLAALPPGALTGHTADDRAETILINLLRGSGLDGLAAMGPDPTRPLLALRRHETRSLCADLGLTPVVDPSNTDPRFVRNRVRGELLPLMADIAGRDVVPARAPDRRDGRPPTWRGSTPRPPRSTRPTP